MSGRLLAFPCRCSTCARCRPGNRLARRCAGASTWRGTPSGGGCGGTGSRSTTTCRASPVRRRRSCWPDRVGHVGDPGRLGRGDASQSCAAHRGGAVRHARGDAPRADRPGDRAGPGHGPGDGAGAAAHRGRAAGRGLRQRSSRSCGATSPTGPARRPSPAGQVRAIPAEGNEPAVWLLGSTGYSAELAGLLGLPFAFAYHFSAANAWPALALYRRTFRPSARLAEPYCLISVSVLCAEDAATAQWLHGSSRLSMLRLRARASVHAAEPGGGRRASLLGGRADGDRGGDRVARRR